MADYLHNDVYDLGLTPLTTIIENLYICSALPATFTEASVTYKLGTKAAPPITGPEDRPGPDGRRVSVTAITDGTQTWQDYGDGHLEYMIVDPAETTPMVFDTAKAQPVVFGSRVGQDDTYATSALFEGRTNIFQTPGDMFVFTMHINDMCDLRNNVINRINDAE